jgi:hypothetical protein
MIAAVARKKDLAADDAQHRFEVELDDAVEKQDRKAERDQIQQEAARRVRFFALPLVCDREVIADVRMEAEAHVDPDRVRRGSRPREVAVLAEEVRVHEA